MKLYVIQEIGYEYNDWSYDRTGVSEMLKAFRNKATAEAEVAKLNAKKLAGDGIGMLDASTEQQITEFYTLAEVEAEDDEIEEVSYKSARKRLAAARETANNAAQTAFKTEAAALFEAHPELSSFGWTQYTPYFNDGDTCHFGAYIDEPDINGQDGNDLDSGREWDGTKYAQVREPGVEYTLQEPVREFLRQFDKSDLEAIFGDHVRVTVYRGGRIKKEEHEHD